MVEKQMSGVASNKLSNISPSNGAKPSSLISQMRTTSHGGPNSKDEQHYNGSDQYTQGGSSEMNVKNKAGNSKTNTNNGLAMSQTRTTTHTSNQHNSGGNVAAPPGVGQN
jgi:hypothetical protein